MPDHRPTRADVAGLDGFDRLQKIHEAGADCLDDRRDELTRGMRALSVLFWFVGDVDNGGFWACMDNSSGDVTGEAISAARLIGADRHAELFERFAAIALQGDLTMDAEARERRGEEMSEAESEALEALDDEFYELPSIDEALGTYVDRNPEEFFRD